MLVKASWISKEWDYNGPAPVLKDVEHIVELDVPDNSTKLEIAHICMIKDVTLEQ